jgi:hypothetical protein
MRMNFCRVVGMALALVAGGAASGAGQVSGQVVVLSQEGFPAVDSAAVAKAAVRGARAVGVAALPGALADAGTSLLVMPYGSAFPEEDWPAIKKFLQRGGNLLTLGGRPFTRPVYEKDGRWETRAENYAFARELFLSDYQAVGGSDGMNLQTNGDLVGEEMPALRWSEAYSVVIRLSDEGSSERIGASGLPDSDLKTVLWGVKDGVKLAAPVIEIDHYKNDFAGGRWIMMNCDPVGGVSQPLVARLVGLAMQGATLMRVTPGYPLYVAGETPAVEVEWNRLGMAGKDAASVEVVVEQNGKQESRGVSEVGSRQFKGTVELPGDGAYGPGLHEVVATFKCGTERCGVSRTGFWVRDEAYLDAGQLVTVDGDLFQLQGRKLPVVGTTYMDSKAQRLFLRYPNPYVWDQDMRQITNAGMNMLRTGLWTDWDVATGGTSTANEHTLRTIEAFLMTARKYNLPVQFNLFAFMPEVFGGGNPYLDPEAVKQEQTFVRSVVARFHAVPFLIWDLMNEPSFDNPKRFFGTKPNGDAIETAEWNRWLLARYGSREEIASLWKMDLPAGPLPVPDEGDFYGGSGGKVLTVYDFNLFTQEKFTEWVKGMREVIRDTGSKQLMTVGTDEGGGLGSVSPAFFRGEVDFTTMHSWWLYDDLLWDSLVAKQRGMPMLVQETGVMFEPDLAGRPRRTLANEADLLERKVGIALGTGAGAIEWLWNINSLMQSQQEVTIGAVRWDGTEKPEAEVLKGYGRFVFAARDQLRHVDLEDVSILTSQALQYSPLSSLATMAQQRSVRVMNYQCRTPARVVSENNVADIAGSKLVVLPSPQALSETTWKALLRYVNGGGNLLVTGPVDRDEHWEKVDRLREIGVAGEAEALDYRGAQVEMGAEKVDVGFGVDAQKHAETLTLADGKTYLEVKHGSGRIFLVASPVELAESPEATEEVYTYVLAAAGVAAPFKAKASAAVLIRPRLFEASTLYLLVSESAEDEALDIEDARSGTHLKVTLPAQRTELILLDRVSGRVLASYGGPAAAETE